MRIGSRHGWALAAVVALVASSAALLSTLAQRQSPDALARASTPLTPVVRSQSAPAPVRSIDARLTEQVTAAMRKAALQGSVTVAIADLASGAVVVDVGGERPMRPASNQKVLTTATALAVLGCDFHFETKLLLRGDVLTIVGDGDPSLGDPELLAGTVWKDATGAQHTGLTPEQLIDQWTAAVERLRVPRIATIVVDDRIIARDGYHPDWPADQREASYCANCYGVNFHFNSLKFFLTPSDGRVIWRSQPSAPWLTVSNDATARGGKGQKQSAGITRGQGNDAYRLVGNLARADGPYILTLQDPPMFLGHMLASRLRAAGVDVGSVRLATADDPRAGGSSVGPTLSTPLASVIARANTDSENLYAEALLKRTAAKATGRAGNWADGQALLQGELRQHLGREAESFSVRDGSGMSRQNRVTARGMVAWLLAMKRALPCFDAYLHSFAEGGSTGTLKKRMDRIPDSLAKVWCKTGYISRTSCLSGYVMCANGRQFVLSVLCNDMAESQVGTAKDLQDEIARLLASQPKG